MSKDKKNPNGSGEKPKISSSHPFQDLAKMVVAFPELPDLQEEGLDLESLKKQAEVIRAKAKDVGEWAAGALAYLDSVETLGREERELATIPITKAQEGLERLLRQETTRAYRRAAWLACLKHMLSREFRSPEEIRALFRKLVEEGYLKEAPDGLLQLNGTSYAVPEEAAFDDPEIQEISGLMAGLTEKVRQAERTARRQRAEEMVSQGGLSIEEFLEGKPGKLAIQIPPEKVEQEGNGVFWRYGGLLLVESDGEKCWPLKALGGQSFEGAIGEAIDLGVNLPVSSLRHEKPPFPQRLPDESRRKFQLLWHLLKRRIGRHKAKNQLAEAANLRPTEFFLGGKPGICLVEYEGTWDTPEDERIYDVFFLAERRTNEDDNTSTVRVLNVPAHLSEFLGEYADQEYPEEERFNGIPYPLGAVLKAVYGQTQKVAKIASEQG